MRVLTLLAALALARTAAAQTTPDTLVAEVRTLSAATDNDARFDALTALENWVERGIAPASMLATKQGSSLSRPLCPYPELPRYKGSGDPNDAASFACAVP